VTSRRTRTAAGLLTLLPASGVGLTLTSSPTYAEPSIKTVQARVDHLFRQAEQASERYDTARLRLASAHTRLVALRHDLQHQRSVVAVLRRQVAATVVAEYQGQNLAQVKMVLSPDPDTFLEQLASNAQYDDQQHEQMATYAVQAQQLDMRARAASREVSRMRATERQMKHDKATIDAKASQAKDLLSRLKSEAAAAAARTSAPSRSGATSRPSAPVPNVPASGRAAAAVSYAMAQVGKAYVYGAAGPSAFDCSGLTMMAWQAAGVSLPHSSSAQQGYGTPVSESQLQPGDLVFYYSPVSHVGMYIGGGKIVNAENPSVGVVVAPLHLMPYSGAVRPG